MLRRYSFIPVFSILIGILVFWSSKYEKSLESAENPKKSETLTSKSDSNRQELIENLDRIVAYQHYFHSVYGHFTKVLNKIGFHIPQGLTQLYEIRVVEASSDRLLISAFSESEGKVTDLVSIDQDFQIHANFKVPEPRLEYLKAQASRHLRLLSEAPKGQRVEEQGVFKGFFQFVRRTQDSSQSSWIAIGIRNPVDGIEIKLDSSQTGQEPVLNATWDELEKVEPATDSAKTGQMDSDHNPGLEEETFLAQQIFKGEIGRYAKSWEELSRIANFKFEGKDQYGEPLPISPTASSHPSAPARKITSSGGALEIEPIEPGAQ